MSSTETIQRWLAASRNAWNERAGMFDELSSANAKAADRQTELDAVFGALGLELGARVLDAGCGTGHFAIAFAERGYAVDGIDLSPDMIERARRNAKQANVHVELSVGDLVPLSAPDGAYAAIVSRMVLQFSPHLSAVLDEFGRVVNARGKLWLAVPGALSPVYRHSWRRFLLSQPEPMNYVVPWELAALLEEKGWSIDQQWGSFDAIGAEAGNAATDIDVHALPLPLQQASATVWNLIAVRATTRHSRP